MSEMKKLVFPQAMCEYTVFSIGFQWDCHPVTFLLCAPRQIEFKTKPQTSTQLLVFAMS